jgi:hypothetical protein
MSEMLLALLCAGCAIYVTIAICGSYANMEDRKRMLQTLLPFLSDRISEKLAAPLVLFSLILAVCLVYGYVAWTLLQAVPLLGAVALFPVFQGCWTLIKRGVRGAR